MSSILECSGYYTVKTDIIRAQDCYLYDSKDKRYLDLESGVWCTALGHNNKRINKIFIKQLQLVSHLGYRYTNPIVENAAKRILETVKIFEGKCVFLSSGSEAVEFAVQSAKRIIKQNMFITLSDSYLSAYGSASEKNSDEWYCFDWSRYNKCTNLEKCNLNCEYLNEISTERIGALIFEPGNASGLVKLPPKQLITTLENMVKEQGGLIIIDEVTTGIGRTGKWYGFEHYNIKPDIVAIGKGLGNGYPVSAVVMSQKVAENLETHHFHYAQSHQNDPLGSSEVIATVEDNRLIDRSYYLGIKLLKDLKKLAKKHSCIKEVRGRGLMVAVEFNNNTEKFSLENVYLQLVEKGFLPGFKPSANLLRFYPPLTIKEDDINSMISSLDQVLSTTE